MGVMVGGDVGVMVGGDVGVTVGGEVGVTVGGEVEESVLRMNTLAPLFWDSAKACVPPKLASPYKILPLEVAVE